jgi:hypothetical protein
LGDLDATHGAVRQALKVATCPSVHPIHLGIRRVPTSIHGILDETDLRRRRRSEELGDIAAALQRVTTLPVQISMTIWNPAGPIEEGTVLSFNRSHHTGTSLVATHSPIHPRSHHTVVLDRDEVGGTHLTSTEKYLSPFEA